MTTNISNLQTLSRFVLSDTTLTPEKRRDMEIILSQIALACKVVSNAVRRAGIEHLHGEAGIVNVQGEDVKKLDLIANGAFIHALTHSRKVCCMVSEEDADMTVVDKENRGKYCLTFDPLDGSSNLDCNVSVGSIWGIYERTSGESEEPTPEKDVLRPGNQMIAAGYALYGSSTMFVFTLGGSVNGFTLDQSLGEFVLTHENMEIKERGRIFSVNEGNSVFWPTSVREFVKDRKDRAHPYSARYIGSMVSDIHRTLLYGGIFMYPGDSRAPNGKLRYLYEVAPLSMVVEKAGGKSSTGTQRCLDVTPHQIHERCPVFIGSKLDVEELVGFFSKFPAKE